MGLKLVYFASVRERLGTAEEVVDLPDAVRSVGDLVAWQIDRSPDHARAVAVAGGIRVALDKRLVGPDEAVGASGEVAFFPPMTGG